MAKTDAVRDVPARLNLGCGEDYREGWHNVDVVQSVGPDDVLDLAETPWALPSAHFERIEARHVLEHLDTVPWDELVRVLQPGGELVVTYPLGHTRFEDPTHRQFWNWHTAATLAGERAHGHEMDVPLRLVGQSYDWAISQTEPLVECYTRYRLWLRGPGPWLEQVPGLYGELTATYRRESR